MRTLIYSDVHGNLPGFEKILKDAGPCEAYISLGDIVDFGPWGNECIDLAASLPNSTFVMGNHEEDYLKGRYSGLNETATLFFNKTIEKFDRYNFIANFLQTFKFEEYICVHTLNDKNIYPDTDVALDANYLIGHSHHQFVYKNNGFTLYNAGSVGQNRKHINVSNYLVYDSISKKIELHNCIHDIEVVISEMRALKYPQVCIDYYVNKELKLS
jgi:predicted phosphodiesterase